jgi:hypothetical protein
MGIQLENEATAGQPRTGAPAALRPADARQAGKTGRGKNSNFLSAKSRFHWRQPHPRLMNIRPGLFLLFCAALSPGFAAAPAGFTALFNGRDLTGWRGGETYDHRQLLALPEAERTAQIAKWTAGLTERKDGKSHWSVEAGELLNDGLGTYATTERDYGDFELLVDWKITAGTDSGIYLRGVPQIQIWDPGMPDPNNNGAAKGSGGLWNNDKSSPGRDPLVRADKPLREWNHFRIIAVGSRVTVWLNEQLVVDHSILENYFDKNLLPAQRRPIPTRGPIQLQTHGGETRWRNLYIREIGSDEATRLLASRGTAGYTSIFDGKSLDGWAGPLEVVAVKDGALVWQKGKGGTIYWNQDLADFQARVQFKLPPAGNNGLAIRYPGTGDTAYVGMCELQVLDDNYEKTKGPIDPRQAHGSAYGMVAAARGYQHPLGEWNFQEVTVRGSRIAVELNGTVILDTDLAAVDPAAILANKPHPGKDRARGFFGFAGHNDPVEFRAVFIKSL